MTGVLGMLIPGLTPVVKKLVDLIPDPNARAKAAAEAQSELLKVVAEADAGQRKINEVEAGNSSLFVAGWRPAIGWVCALSLFYQYLGRPIATAIFDGMHWPLPYLPALDDNLWQLMLGMLGLGGLRTFEKTRGVATK
jgi:hypothetical protein